MIRVTLNGGAANAYPLTFNGIKNVPGAYEHKNGDVLIVVTKKSKFVKDDGMRTGYTRTGHILFDKSAGRLRKTANDKSPDGVAQWRQFKGTLTLAG